ncbi:MULTISPECIES: LytR C-terminal domain-containing protein [Nocardia]|uniref:LytR C-terminal domain-containing protein n=1 Tax=Nocardia TaxID=1817 RepID=UPI0007EC1C7B|nr:MULTISPECIES: LytR C-terminal domain-containing protein [Nocardia]OBF68762.1 glycoprotein [Mycobacterium sp. 852002-51759_SCH5129042]MBF6277803.1 LytR C-terminal domain-containing protein [Nocardia nova]MBV7701172.1 LytR C-terminal domain-containing protein [Nocardia nova]OBA52832.1 glycoprotein [Nocardia sp. 852002-51101_SCH5132738]OBB45176.1 glycoprotein [Nocardia sp. 852002-51244_SCH5132740]
MSNPNPPSGGPPLRALAMVLIALAIVFAGLGAMALSNSSSDSAAAETSSDTETTAAPVTTTRAAATTTAATTTAAPTSTLTTTTAAATSTTAGVDKTVPVRVLNNSTVAGLASRTGSQLTASGFDVTETGNYPGGVIAKTTVYYGNSPHERETAQAIANELGVSAEPRFAGIADSPPGVIVIVTGN